MNITYHPSKARAYSSSRSDGDASASTSSSSGDASASFSSSVGNASNSDGDASASASASNSDGDPPQVIHSKSAIFRAKKIYKRFLNSCVVLHLRERIYKFNLRMQYLRDMINATTDMLQDPPQGPDAENE